MRDLPVIRCRCNFNTYSIVEVAPKGRKRSFATGSNL